MSRVKIGVLGLYRGSSMINYCLAADNAELVAICDKWEEGVRLQKERHKDLNITYYTDFDEFLKHDMDMVVLANYANEHTPFAIKAMKAGKHVFSEVLPVQTMKEAVELAEAVEETGMLYGYAENYCYMAAPYEMRRLYREGKLGEFQYGEGEYIHNCENVWPSLAYGDKNHWRNNMYATYYCTHSLGPIIHITGLRPVSVVGTES
ncbi:MAG: Gfo/Idh/MocA family oxidoreductase, partial [Clostridia bacterium]|nr:Gfo/Idh/MocA family oxidoreductase [Clostridia bacterium]